MRDFKFQIGQFFLVIGVIMLALFFATGNSGRPQYLVFFGGLLIGGAGISLMVRSRPASPGESARFKRVRKARQKAADRREKKRQQLKERRER